MKESRKQNNAALPKEELREKLYYLKRSIFHPFDGFYEIRFRRKGSTLLAVALLLIFGVLRCVEHQYTGFIMDTNELQAMNSVSIFSTTVLVLVLFAVSNLCTGESEFLGQEAGVLHGYPCVPSAEAVAAAVAVHFL